MLRQAQHDIAILIFKANLYQCHDELAEASHSILLIKK